MRLQKKKFIDIEKIIQDKNPSLFKRLPKFIISYLKKILHEEEMNLVMDENEGKNGVEFSHNVLEKFKIEVKVSGLENVPKDGGVILASNHPLGGMDALALIKGMKAHRSDFKFVVNDILLALKNLKGLFVGVNKHGKTSAQALQAMNDIFSSEAATFVFPAGLVSRRLGKTIGDLEWKKTFISRAKKFNRPVVPVFVDGCLSKKFYRLAKIRTFFGVKANIEMLYLVDEQFRLKNKTIHIYFGEPIASSTFDETKSDKHWANWVKNIVYNLKQVSN